MKRKLLIFSEDIVKMNADFWRKPSAAELRKQNQSMVSIINKILNFHKDNQIKWPLKIKKMEGIRYIIGKCPQRLVSCSH